MGAKSRRRKTPDAKRRKPAKKRAPSSDSRPKSVSNVVPSSKKSRLKVGQPTLPLVDRSLLKQALSEYQYHSPNRTICEDLYLTRFWDWVAEFYPVWLAPNMVTSVGFLCSVSGLLLVLWHSPNLDGRAPAWVHLVVAFLLWIYQTADGSDGPQARRMRCGSALGELYDHGVDALVTTFIWAVAADNTGQGITFPMIPITIVSVQAAFFFSNITLLHYSKQLFNRVDAQEVQAFIQLLCISSYFVKTFGIDGTGQGVPHVPGTPIVAYPFNTPIPVQSTVSAIISRVPVLPYLLALEKSEGDGGDIVRLYAVMNMLMSLATCVNGGIALYQTSQMYRKGEAPKENLGVTGRSSSAFQHQVTTFAIWSALVIWGWNVCLTDGESTYSVPHVCWFVVAAFGSADIANHLLVLRVAKLPFPELGRSRGHWLMGTFAVWNEIHNRYATTMNLPNGNTVCILLALFAIGVHLHYSITVGGAIADGLDVTFFTVPMDKQEAGRKKGFWG